MRNPARTTVWSRRLALGAILSLLSAAVIGIGPAYAATPFDTLLGAWSGSGQIRYEDQASESIRCSAYYSGGGTKLRLAIRCKSTSTEIEIRGVLSQQGSRVTGTWEERTFNASGEASGSISASRINLSISGGGFSGSMAVSYGGARQTVTISTQGIKMRSVHITLGKS
ncbi:MAG: hypothetical protein F9K29_04280 [Hyphomicrobiaceae bacterium]|nr:MAG: hypothetical protein F9K29_04280 [Hyphomicrobiaceae bacterium]